MYASLVLVAAVTVCAVSSMRATGIALRNPKDARWLLRDGDQLVHVQGTGGPSQWAISVAGNNNGGRDVLIVAQLQHEGFRNVDAGDNVDDMAGGRGLKVAQALEKLLALKPEEKSADLLVREDIMKEYEAQRPIGAGGLDISSGADDDDYYHDQEEEKKERDFLKERATALAQPRDTSLLSAIEIALGARTWDRETVFFELSVELAYHIVHKPAVTRVTPIKEKVALLAPLYVLRVLSPAADWRSLLFLTRADITIGEATLIRLGAASSSNPLAKQPEAKRETERLPSAAPDPSAQPQPDPAAAGGAGDGGGGDGGGGGGPGRKDWIGAAPEAKAIDITTNCYGPFRASMVEDLPQKWRVFDSLIRAADATGKQPLSALVMSLYGGCTIALAKTGRKKGRQGEPAAPMATRSLSIIAMLGHKLTKHTTLHLWMVGDGKDAKPEFIPLRLVSTPALVVPSAERLLELKAIAANWIANDRPGIVGLEQKLRTSPSTKAGRSIATRRVQCHSDHHCTPRRCSPLHCSFRSFSLFRWRRSWLAAGAQKYNAF
jgi:hypothetical protein